ncbi:hypothetical protein Gotur_032067, partial [Gossypium turneri]
MVLHGSSHISAHAMSQTWSYGGPLISVPTPCPRYGLTWDLSSRCQRHVPDMVLHGISLSKCHDFCIQYIPNISTGLVS